MFDRLANTSLSYLISMSVLLVLLIGICPRLLLKARRRTKQRAKTPRWIGAALATWFVVTLLAVTELGFALLYDATDSFSMTNVSRRWFRIHAVPSERVLRFSDGSGIAYRDDVDFPKSVPNSERHVVFLGDSFTYGHGVAAVSDRFSNRVRHGLTGRDQTVHVTNLAKPGTDLNWAAAMLEQLGSAKYQIDLAVYVMCLNDIEAFHDPRMQRSIQLAHFEPPTFLFRDTYFFNWMFFRGQQLAHSGGQDYYSFVKEFYAGEPWQRFANRLDGMNALCRKQNTKLCVVVFPFLQGLGKDYAFEEVHKQIVETCHERDIEVIDLLPALSPHVGDGLTVNPFDAHPNERAHELAAEHLLKHLPLK